MSREGSFFHERRIELSEKRRDSKNRILRNGESQRKDGRYAFKYSDVTGKVHFVYSWKLESTDKIPQGKRDDISLREKEKTILKSLDDEISPFGGNLTVIALSEKYVLQKPSKRYGTQKIRKSALKVIGSEPFGKKRIDKVRLSDAKAWFVQLQQNGRSFCFIQMIHNIVRPAFQMAVEDDLIRKNPFDFKLSSVIVNDGVKKTAITEEEEKDFLEFVKNNESYCKYYDGIYILFKTGLRISEFAGLTLSDIDMKNRYINIDHQLQRTNEGVFVIESPKTKSGIRAIPMTDDVYECFEHLLKNREKPKSEPVVDGKSGFLYLDQRNQPSTARSWERHFQYICQKYNETHCEKLLKITPHICRHTFCTNMAKSGMNPKVLQYLMGHSEIGVTLDTYTHVGYDDAKSEMKRLQEIV